MVSFGGVGNPLYDPATTRQLANGTWVRDPLPDRRVPLSRFDPVAAKIIGIDPGAGKDAERAGDRGMVACPAGVAEALGCGLGEEVAAVADRQG